MLSSSSFAGTCGGTRFALTFWFPLSRHRNEGLDVIAVT